MKPYLFFLLFIIPFVSFSQESVSLNRINITSNKLDKPNSNQTIQIIVDKSSVDNNSVDENRNLKIIRITENARKTPDLNKNIEIEKVNVLEDKTNMLSTNFTIQKITGEKLDNPQNIEIKLNKNNQ